MKLINGVPQNKDGLIFELMAKYPPYFKESDIAKWPRINGKLKGRFSVNDLTSSFAGTNRTVTDANGLQITLPASVPAIDHIGNTLAPTLRLEPAAANILLGAPPVTQDLTLPIGSFTLQVFGAGTATPSAGTATITGEAAASNGTPNTFAVTVAGTVTITIATATVVWLCPGTIPSSYFAGAAAIGSELVSNGAFTQVAGAAVTLANMRLSAVAGTAFIDFSAADLLTDHIGKVLTIKDSAGKVLIGYIKAAGTGETYEEKMSNGGFDSDTVGWTVLGGSCTLASIEGGQSGNCLELTWVSGSSYVYQDFTGVVNALYIFSRYLKSGTSGDGSSNGGIYTTAAGAARKTTGVIASTGSWVVATLKWVATGTGLAVALVKANTTPGTMLFDEVSLKKVLTPSATGVTIVSTPGGATYNWTYQETGFNYNDAGNYTYEIYDTDWLYGTGWYPSSNTAVKIAGTASDLTQTGTPAEAGKVYRVGHTAVRTAGTLTPEFGSTNGAAISANGTYYDYLTAADTDYIKFKADAAFAGSVDVATIKEHGTVRASEANTVTLAIPADVAAALAVKGTIVIKGRFAFARAAGVVTAILSSQDATASLAYTTTAAGNLSSFDGTTVAESTGAYAANVDWKIAITFPSSAGKYRIGVDVDGAGIVQGTEVNFDGAFTATANLILGRVLHGATWIKYIKIYDKVLTNAQINSIN